MFDKFTDGEVTCLIVGGVIGAIAGAILMKLVCIVKDWLDRRKFKREEEASARWIKNKSISQLAEAIDDGKLTLSYPMKILMIKIANAIETSDNDTEADDSNGMLSADLMTLGQLKKGEKY